VDRLETLLGHPRVVLVAGGIGVTPLVSMLQSICQRPVHAPRTRLPSNAGAPRRDPGLVRHVAAVMGIILNNSAAELRFGDLSIHITVHQTWCPQEEPEDSAKGGGSFVVEEPSEAAMVGNEDVPIKPFRPSCISLQASSFWRRGSIALCTRVFSVLWSG